MKTFPMKPNRLLKTLWYWAGTPLWAVQKQLPGGRIRETLWNAALECWATSNGYEDWKKGTTDDEPTYPEKIGRI